ncbi:MAG TPA: hypothetical protein VE910_07075, partial [Dongiaceae bacterium]|nr:hypothetical protein [Dongiaceae bacterium]
MQNPGRLFKNYLRRLGIEPEEEGLLALIGSLVGVLLCAYTVAKVLRDSLFLSTFGALNLPYAYIVVAFASAGTVWLEQRVRRRFAGMSALRFNQLVAIGFSVLAALIYPFWKQGITVLFYLWTGSQAIMLLPYFWALAMDVWDSRRARRLFPLLTGCGLLGGTLGGAMAGWGSGLVQRVGLMWALSILLVFSYVLTGMIERHHRRRRSVPEAKVSVSRWQIFRNSAYLKVLATGMVLSVAVSTLVDFQFKFFITQLYTDPHDLTRFLGKFYAGLNALSLLFQFTAAGWLLHRFGLGPSSGLQPLTAVSFGLVTGLSAGWFPILGLRWLQGIVFQGLGKSSNEIYYMALRPFERRIIKPAVDTLVERWGDALVGVMLVVVLHLFRVPVGIIAIITGVMAILWFAVITLLNRQFGRAFETALTLRWTEPDLSYESLHTPAARRALLGALNGKDERRILAALELSRYAGDAALARAVAKCLEHPSVAIRRAAVEAMRVMQVRGHETQIESLLDESDYGLRRAAVEYLLELGPRPADLVQRLLNADEPAERDLVLDVLFEHPHAAAGAITLEWISEHLEAGAHEDAVLAARALGIVSDANTKQKLLALLTHEDVDVRRAALVSAARRPHPSFVEAIVPQLLDPAVSYESERALAAIGNPAIPGLVLLLEGSEGARAQVLGARTLALIGTSRAIKELTRMVRNTDRRARHVALQGLVKAREDRGRPVLSRSLAHRLFLRELAEYRRHTEHAERLRAAVHPELRLLSESFREFAEMALDRALRALACWYAPKPLAGAFERLKSREPEVLAPGLEYLGHVLPGGVFRAVTRIFEGEAREDTPTIDSTRDLEVAIRFAWEAGDEWLRACAVRASRYLPEMNPDQFRKDG